VSWLGWIVCATAGLGTMRAAIDRGDIDEAARQGMLAGPSIIVTALAAPDRPARLAGIAAAPSATDRENLLLPLAKLAAKPDRRTAIPAATAARTIARELARRTDPPDDIPLEDIATWRDRWAELARGADRWIELRVIALDTAAALDRTGGIGVDLAAALADPDPAFRRAAIAVVPMPVPPSMRAPLAQAVVKDTDAAVALAAAATLCADLAVDPVQPVLDALGGPGIERIRALVTGSGSPALIKDAKRCLR
jgi:hypothetical protein